MIILKSNREIEYIRAAGRITADALMLMRELAVPGCDDTRTGPPL